MNFLLLIINMFEIRKTSEIPMLPCQTLFPFQIPVSSDSLIWFLLYSQLRIRLLQRHLLQRRPLPAVVLQALQHFRTVLLPPLPLEGVMHLYVVRSLIWMMNTGSWNHLQLKGMTWSFSIWTFNYSIRFNWIMPITTLSLNHCFTDLVPRRRARLTLSIRSARAVRLMNRSVSSTA